MKAPIFKSLIAASALLATLTSCEDEKDLIIIDGNLPIKTSTLYMVGDATPNGWSMDNPTPLEKSNEDALVFNWNGPLKTGEMKLCLAPGSWDAAFIRPMENGATISKTDITDAKFQMHAGDPDEKWKIDEAGNYHLTFNLRNWTMSTTYLGAPDAPTIEPITTSTLYIVGDATPNGWNIDSPNALQQTDAYTFVYEGVLHVGDFKACIQTGSWDAQFIRPEADATAVNKNGVSNESFIYVASPDNKWHVEDAGEYRLTFDLKNWTIKAEYLREPQEHNQKDPIESETLYMIGDATPGGWSMDDATAYTRSSEDGYIFIWQGQLVNGTFKACLAPDPTFACPFIRPSGSDVTVSADGVSASDFVYTTAPDDQWRVTQSGEYKITFNLKDWTIAVESIQP